MGEREIRCFAGGDGKGNADQARLLFVQTGSFGIKRNAGRMLDFVQPAFQCRCIQNGFVMDAVCAIVRQKGRRGFGLCFCARLGCCAWLINGFEPSFETIVPEYFTQGVLIFRCGEEIGYRHGQCDIGFNGGERAAQRQEFEVAAQIFANHAFDVGSMGNDAIQIAIGLYPFGGGFGPDLRYARNVIGGITYQCQVVGNAVWRYTELGFYTGHIQTFVTHGVDEGHLRRHQLCQIFVAGRYDYREPCLRSLFCQGPNDVIGFHAAFHKEWPAQRPHDGVDGCHLLGQIFRHRWPMGFVVAVKGVAESRAAGVKNTGAVFCVDITG